MVLGGTLTEWATLGVLIAGPGLVATVLWSPVLAAARLRTLFQSLPVSGSLALNYVLTALALSVPWIVGFGWALSEIGAGLNEGTASGEPLVDVAIQLAGLYVVALPVAAGAGLPHLGIDWDRTGYESATWVLLVAASAWYAAIYTVPAVLFGFIVSL